GRPGQRDPAPRRGVRRSGLGLAPRADRGGDRAMSTQTVNGTRVSAYPRPIEELMPEAIVMARRLGEIPSRNALMRAFRIGAPKAGELREALIAERPEVEPERVDEPVVEPAEAPVEPAEDVETDPAPDEPDERPKRSRRWFRRRPRP